MREPDCDPEHSRKDIVVLKEELDDQISLILLRTYGNFLPGGDLFT